MKKQFVTYEMALKLKELGFNEPCLGYYRVLKDWMINNIHNKITSPNWRNNDNTHYFMYVPNPFGDRDSTFTNVFDKNKGGYKNIAVPLWQQVVDWLRKKHGMHIIIDYAGKKADEISKNKWVYYIGNISKEPHITCDFYKAGFHTFEEALENGLFKTLTLIKYEE